MLPERSITYSRILILFVVLALSRGGCLKIADSMRLTYVIKYSRHNEVPTKQSVVGSIIAVLEMCLVCLF